MLVHFNNGHWSGAVGDLGSSMFLNGPEEKVTKEQGTSGWTAPEVFDPDSGYGLPSDIFSFGLVLADAASNGFNNQLIGIENDLYVQRIKKGERPPLPNSDGTGLNELIVYAFRTEAKGRPTSTQLLKRLEEIRDSI